MVTSPRHSLFLPSRSWTYPLFQSSPTPLTLQFTPVTFPYPPPPIWPACNRIILTDLETNQPALWMLKVHLLLTWKSLVPGLYIQWWPSQFFSHAYQYTKNSFSKNKGNNEIGKSLTPPSNQGPVPRSWWWKTKQICSPDTYRGCQGPPGQAKEKEDPSPHGAGYPVKGQRMRFEWMGVLLMESSFWRWIPVIREVILDGAC